MHHIIGHNFDDITHASHSSNIHNHMYVFSGGCLRITSLHHFKLQATYIKHAWWLVLSQLWVHLINQGDFPIYWHLYFIKRWLGCCWRWCWLGPSLAPTMFLNFNYLLIAGSGPGPCLLPPELHTEILTTWNKVPTERLRPDNKRLRSKVMEWHWYSPEGQTTFFLLPVIRPTLYIQFPGTWRGGEFGSRRGIRCFEVGSSK